MSSAFSAERGKSYRFENGHVRIYTWRDFTKINKVRNAELAEALHSQIEDPRAHIKGVCLGIVKHSDNTVQEAASNSDQNGGRFWQARTEPKPRPAPKVDPKWTGNLMPSSTRFAKLSRLDFAKFSRLEHTVIFAKLFYSTNFGVWELNTTSAVSGRHTLTNTKSVFPCLATTSTTTAQD
ncbi:hypothetical protein D9615_007820 [Tricholomella constricta]|uniref:Uncharacterized protein n=1 Tax=Tricholomella constricta TaxID=117010 RepID=A0A8H5H525_9AGAR|nr:hypothetical protein D9615_007820 [Tricholomella constricta]